MFLDDDHAFLSPILIEFHRGLYQVEFRRELAQALENEIQPTDIVFIDSNVLHLYPGITKQIPPYTKMFTIEATEQKKDLLFIPEVIENVIGAGFRRGHRLVAIGGGIVQDIVSFSASILHRGVDWIFFPTTLLAQGDSCIGGKSSVNFGRFKNQIGGFFPPSKVICVETFLHSLPEADFRSGIGEIAHYYCVEGEGMFDSFARLVPQVLGNRRKVLSLIHQTLLIKKNFIEEDEFDLGRRKLLNFGHSFGHAIESATQYKVPHGTAVAYGIDLAFRVSEKLGMAGREEVEKAWSVMREIIGDFEFPRVEPTTILQALSRDKKNTGTSLTLILTSGFGKMEMMAMDEPETIRSVLSERLAEYARGG